jgi:two-component system, LuxR family, response regulator FixJ
MTASQDVVLIADSDSAVRVALKFALEIEGLSVHLCASGLELLTNPELRRAACLVLDDRMLLMAGVSMLDRLIEHNIRIPTILTTSQITDSLRRRAGLAGVRHVLEKPFLNGELLDSIHEVLGHRTPSL